MESIIAKLMVPDNAVIQQGTAELKEAFKSPSAIPELCSVMTTSQVIQTRQYAALLLRKKLAKSAMWSNNLSVQDRSAIKVGCMEALIHEPDMSVKHSIVQLMGVLAKHELPQGSWPELLRFLFQCFESKDASERQLGMFMTSVLSETAPEAMKVHLRDLVKMFHRALMDDSDAQLGFYACQSMTHLVSHVGTDEVAIFQPLVPQVINMIKRLILVDEDKACQAMEIFDELFESEVAIVAPHIKPIVELCLAISSEDNLDDSLRVKAISFLGRLVRMKKKAIVKHKLHGPIISTLFPIMCKMAPDLDDDEDEFNDAESSNSPTVCASQTLDVMAINLPPEKFMAALLSHVQPALQSSDPGLLKGAFYSLAVCVEGCSENIRSKYLVNFLHCIDMGIKHQVPVVRNAALYALGQFSEYLQPEISKYAVNIVPVLLGYIDMAYVGMKEENKSAPSGFDRVFYALGIFCENLEEKLVPFLDELMKRLLLLLNSNFDTHVKELAISGIGSAANAVKAGIVPYFQDIMVPLKSHLTPDQDDDDHQQELLTQSMDTLGSLARAVGPASFAPKLAEECCMLGIELMDKHNDPDVRKCVYSLFASVAFVVKQEMASVMPKIVAAMLVSVSSKEGISLEYKDDSLLPLEHISDEDDISLDDTEALNDLEQVKTINVENAYMEEKEEAVGALKELCVHTGIAFVQYLDSCMDMIWPLLEFPDEDIRKASVEAVTQFIVAYYKQGNEEAFTKAVVQLIPKLSLMIKDDEEVNVVCVCLEMMAELLKQCKRGVTGIQGHPEEIVQCVHRVMKSDCACMDSDDSNEDEEAEQDEVLFEYAGEILPNLGQAMDPLSFSPYFAGLLPQLLRKTKKHCTVAEKSFAAGSLAECMEPLAGCLDPFVSHLMPVYFTLSRDDDDDVRNNAVYGLGELALHGGPSMFQHFQQILHNLSHLLGIEKCPRVIDQVVGAVCRLVLANKTIVPLNDVLPVVLNQLPLKEDLEEYLVVFKCVLLLYGDGNDHVKKEMAKIVDIGIKLVASNSEYDKEQIQPVVIGTLRQYANDWPNEMQAILQAQDQETAAKITSMM